MLTVNFIPFPTLCTDRLTLRRFTKNDASDLFRLRSNENVMQFIDRPRARSMKDALDLIQKINDSLIANEAITWAIALKSYSTVVGTIGFWRIVKEHYRAEIGYLLDPELQGKGFMQEAMQVVLDHGFRAMKLHSVEANVNPENISSIKLLERNHFVKEAHFKENYYYNGRFLDSVIYSRVVSENDK
jgi:ribosomal-protein-alanine N-acetyltransferase